MSRFNLTSLWEERFPNQTKAEDYAGRVMYKAAIGQKNSKYSPTIDHIRPVSMGGVDSRDNIVICNRETNQEKGDSFPKWKANESHFQAKRVRGTSHKYEINIMEE